MIGQGTLAELAERVGESRAHVEVAFDDDRRGRGGRDRRRRSAASTVSPRPSPVAVRRDRMDAGDRATDADEADVRRRVPLAVAEHGLQLVSLRAVEPSLEDIYRHAVARTASAHGEVQ